MKKRATAFRLLMAAFIFIAATSAAFTIPHTQQAYLQQCRTRCGDEYRICLKRAVNAGNSERDRERCHFYNRRCLAKCKPQASPNE
jgi:hypothetical protein